jgi:heterodisulfide reductase subunit A-like polyferredoxin
VEVASEFEMGLTGRRAVHKPFPQAVPNIYTITKPGHAPCRTRCPAGVNAQGYVQLARLGKFDEALEVVHETMPFAGTLGRICPRPCEGACTRAEVEAPIAIATLKRAAADHGEHLPEVEELDDKVRKARARRPVAVVGSGPGGLTAAYNLARKGYPVTVFEKLPVAGGMLRVGVPTYRLPRTVLEQEIDLVRQLGVEIRTSSPVKNLRQLLKSGYKAVFLATGAHASLKLGVPGESLRGVVGAVDLLRRVALGRKVAVGRFPVVVGGGNAAIDAARTLLRLGAKRVTILYRRTRAEMPALPWEIEAALEEGIVLENLAAPVRIIGKGGRVVAVEAIRMRLGQADASGRPRPVPIEGSNVILDCDMVVPAISQAPVLDFMGPRSKIKTSRWGTIVIDEVTGATDVKGVFAGGDVVTGPATAIEAVAAGNRSAEAIHRYLEQGMKWERVHQGESVEQTPEVRPSAELMARVQPAQRVHMAELSMPRRRRTFSEVERGLKPREAMLEAARCLNCAACCECLECQRACQAGAVDHRMKDELVSLEVGACVVATGFEMMDPRAIEEYGAGRIANVITGLELERLLSASGPTGGHVKRPSDHVAPQRIAFIQCVGSRDLRNHAYCSAVCCMHATKEAILAREHDPEVESTIFYMDLRATGKTFQDYVARAKKEYGVRYVRARPAHVEEESGSGDLRVTYEDTVSREKREEIFDLLVLCQAMIPSGGSTELARRIGFELDEHQFIHCPDPLTAPVDTTVPGVLAVGYATGPKDIPDSVVGASAAAARVAELLRPIAFQREGG